MRFMINNSSSDMLLWAVTLMASLNLEKNGAFVLGFSTTKYRKNSISQNGYDIIWKSHIVVTQRNRIQLDSSGQNSDDYDLLSSPKKTPKNNTKNFINNIDERSDTFNKKKKRKNKKNNSRNSKRQNNTKKDNVKSSMEELDGDVKQTTIPGGSSLIFGMARRMMVWQAQNMYTDSTITDQLTGESDDKRSKSDDKSETKKIQPRVLPRWHPHAGISDINPSFRLESPVMNNRGYAGVLQRNSRKRNKPSLYRYALRTYDKMRKLETSQKENNQNRSSSKLTIRRSSTHHLSALVACSKLGLWKESLRIYNEILQDDVEKNKNKKISKSSVSEAMIHAIIRSCVRASKGLYRQYNKSRLSSSDDNYHYYSEPLDSARKILESMTEKHDIWVTSAHVNPLAAAYMYIKMPQAANDLIESHLHHPVADANQYDQINQSLGTFHIEDIQARDKGTYQIQISNAVSESDWEGAVQHLYEMDKVGLNPSTKELNKWSEIHHYK